MSISKDLFCEVMCIAYEINYAHPEWSMNVCIELAVRGYFDLTDLQKQSFSQGEMKKE